MVTSAILLPRGELVMIGGQVHVSLGMERAEYERQSSENREAIWAVLGFTQLPPLVGVPSYVNAFFLNTGEHGRPLDVILTEAELFDEGGEPIVEVEPEPESELEPEAATFPGGPDLPGFASPLPVVADTGLTDALRLEIANLQSEIQRIQADNFYSRDLERQAAAAALLACQTEAADAPRTITLEQDFRPQGADVLFLPDFNATPVLNYIVDWFQNVPGEARELWDAPVAKILGDFVDAIPGLPDLNLSTLQTFISGQIAGQLKPLLSVANIDRSDFPSGAREGTIEAELRVFEQDADRAINGAALATSAVVALNILAAAADGATQVASLGQIQGFQQLVQNLIWATGLSDVGGLTFRPQVATSFAPLLQRYWNSQSQAMLPGQGDIQRFLVREIFDPARREELLGTEDLSQIKLVNRQLGFSDYWTENYWAAHWNLLSQGQLDEALHRGFIDIEEWRRQVRFNDVVPEGVKWLEQIIYKPFTRVDTRRMENLGVLTLQQTLKAYSEVGYFAPMAEGGAGGMEPQFVSQSEFNPSVHKAQAMVVFTEVFNALPSIRRRLSKGNLRPEDVLGELEATGMPAANAELLRDGLVKAEDLDTAEATRELTTAQVIRGAKRGLISFDQAQFLLRELGWRPERAEFLLRLQTSPEDAPSITELGQRLITGAPAAVEIFPEFGEE